MGNTSPICGVQLSPNPFAMCRYNAPAGNSFRFRRYKTASHLHISQLLKLAHFQPPARISDLTPLLCADTESRGYPPAQTAAGAAERDPFLTPSKLATRLVRPDPSGPATLFARSKPMHVQSLPHSPLLRRIATVFVSCVCALFKKKQGGYPPSTVRKPADANPPRLSAWRAPISRPIQLLGRDLAEHYRIATIRNAP
jgi:hypothetical protein